MKNNKRWLAIVLLFLLIISFTACSSTLVPGGSGPVPNTEGYEVNEAIACEQYDYNKPDEYPTTNLTKIGNMVKEDDHLFLGVKILSDYETYNEIRSDAVTNQPDEFKKTRNAFSYAGVTEENFEQYDFLMIDLIHRHTRNLYPRLENLTVEDGKVSIVLLYDYYYTTMSSNSGVLYFIPIPKGCTSAEVIPLHTSFAGD